MEAKTELKYIFANINDWLKFAEAKHGGLVVLNAGLVVGILSSYSNIQNFIYKPTILIGIICFGISVFLSIISQFPVTQYIFHNKKAIQNPNLYFFGHLTHLDSQTFIDEYKKVDTSFAPSKFDTDLINQILVNARIAQSKFVFFKFASYLTAFGSGLLGLTSIIKVVWHF
ncbi:MAG: Pycsar system effector family protein [Bacteroidota bacterium]